MQKQIQLHLPLMAGRTEHQRPACFCQVLLILPNADKLNIAIYNPIPQTR